MKRAAATLAALVPLLCFGWDARQAMSVSEAQVLAYRAAVDAGDRTAVRTLFSLSADGAAAEDKDIVLGRLIRKEPRLFLQELQRSGTATCRACIEGLLGNLGDEYVDRFAAQAEELRERQRALRSVRAKSLVKLRDTCIQVLDAQIQQAQERAQ